MAGVNKTVFVTVGSTKFDKFTEVLVTPGVLKVLKSRGYTRLKIQYGNGSFIPPDCSLEGVQISSYRFKDSLQQDMSSADLILSHAGAGTCLEALGLGKKLVVVVNEDLHDNHQLELAQKFAELGYLLFNSYVKAACKFDWQFVPASVRDSSIQTSTTLAVLMPRVCPYHLGMFMGGKAGKCGRRGSRALPP
ncbi:UDP-N-acetylglucosamine transferase subunit ALG13 homolog [Cloeon dipterum]|uniref:UDP-N-acetylglucosamine transferase subunit ALG13 homolog n=1 Tax=Cloeon dipterum TaxID=197152 RepID=UPI00322064D0